MRSYRLGKITVDVEYCIADAAKHMAKPQVLREVTCRGSSRKAKRCTEQQTVSPNLDKCALSPEVSCEEQPGGFGVRPVLTCGPTAIEQRASQCLETMAIVSARRTRRPQTPQRRQPTVASVPFAVPLEAATTGRPQSVERPAGCWCVHTTLVARPRRPFAPTLTFRIEKREKKKDPTAGRQEAVLDPVGRDRRAMSVLRRAAVGPKRAFALPMQRMGRADFHEKEKAVEAAFFKYASPPNPIVDAVLTPHCRVL